MHSVLHRISITACVFVGALAGSAHASVDTTELPGAPLHVHVGEQGQLQGFLDGFDAGIFYSPRQLAGDAGFFLAFPDDVPNHDDVSGRVFGFAGAAGPSPRYDPYDDYENDASDLLEYEELSQAPVTGDGSPQNPVTQVTKYTVAPDYDDLLTVTQTTSYVSGTQFFRVRWDVENASGEPVRFKAIAAADFYFEGSDRGTGVFSNGPPRFIGGTNADSGRSGGFVEVGAPATPWSAYQAMPYGNDDDDVWGKVQRSPRTVTPTLDNSVVGEPVDNAGAVEWDQRVGTALPDGGTATFETVIQVAVPAALELSPTNGATPQGTPTQVTASAKDTSGAPYAGSTLRYAIAGANPTSGAVFVGADGTAPIIDAAGNAGADTIVAFLDLNNNGVREPFEPQTSALVTVVDGIPAGCEVKISGDRPGGGGGAGKPLKLAVVCNETVNVSSAGQLAFRITSKAKKKAKKKKKSKRSSRARTADVTAVSAKKKKKKKKKSKKPKRTTRTVRVTLPTTTTTIPAGQAVSLGIAVPTTIAKKYKGKTATASVTLTFTDAAGNVSQFGSTRKLKLRTIKTKKKPKKKKKKNRS